MMRRDRREGKTFAEIAEMYGVSYSTVRDHTLHEPIPRHGGGC
jgi:transposase